MPDVLAADALERAFLFERELADAAEVGMGANTVVGDTEGDPYSTFTARAFAYDFHNPRFVGVAYGDAFAAAVIAILLDESSHAADGLAGGGGALQRQPHKAEVVEQPFAIDQFKAAVEGGLDNGYLVFVHEPNDVAGVFHLGNILAWVCGSPAMDGNLFTGCMACGGAVEERAGESEAVAVVTAHYTAIGGGFLAYDKVGAGHSGRGSEEDEKGDNCFVHNALIYVRQGGAECLYGTLVLFVGCLFWSLGRVDGGIFACIGDGGDDVDERHDGDNDNGYIVQYTHGDGVTEECVGVADGREGGDGNEEGVGNDDNEAELGGAKLDIGKAEFAFEVGVDAHVDGQDEVELEFE